MQRFNNVVGKSDDLELQSVLLGDFLDETQRSARAVRRLRRRVGGLSSLSAAVGGKGYESDGGVVGAAKDPGKLAMSISPEKT